jgi:hypothetical protein
VCGESRKKNFNEARYQWLTFIILATWEADTGRIMVQAHLWGKKKFAKPHLKRKKTKLGVVVHVCQTSYSRECKI